MNAVFAMLKVSNLRAVTVKISVSLGKSHDHRNFLPQAIKGVSGLFAFRVRHTTHLFAPLYKWPDGKIIFSFSDEYI